MRPTSFNSGSVSADPFSQAQGLFCGFFAFFGFRKAFDTADARFRYNDDGGTVSAADFIEFRLRFTSTVP
jgi:hypothetical protein